jgi:type II secretory pathway pseudopilin PulG
MGTRKGFTMVEIVVSMAITILLAGLASFAVARLIANQELNAISGTLVSYLRTAENRALQSEDGISHGVSTSGSKLTLFHGVSYAGRDASLDAITPYPSYLQFSGPSEVVFAKQTGAPSATGAITVSNGTRSIVITIHTSGAISR